MIVRGLTVIFSLLAFEATAASIIVFGGSGRLGAAIIKPLVSAGHEVTVFARPTSDLSLLSGVKIATVTGDVMTADDVMAGLRGKTYDVVINALSRRGNQDGPFYDVSQTHITAAAKATGVKQILFVGSLGAGKSRAVYPDDRWKIYGPLLLEKERAENEIIASGIGYTIIRNDQIVSDDVPATGKAYLSEDQMARGIITRADLGALIAGCAAAERCMNRIYHAVDNVKYLPRRAN